MAPRLELQSLFETLIGSRNVYFQPPPSRKIQYPCIVYSLTDELVDHANNTPYKKERRYNVTVIDTNPDSAIPGKVSDLPKCAFDRHYTADNLNHYSYKLFF